MSCAVLVATGLNNDGHREVLGVRVATSQTAPAWKEFFAELVARGLVGVRLVTSDTHPWPDRRHRQHARTHLAEVPHPLRHQPHAGHPQKHYGPPPKRCRTSVYDQPNTTPPVNAQYDRLLDHVQDKLPTVFEHLNQARANTLTSAASPNDVWTQIRSNNPNERLNRENRRRTNSAGIFPNHQPIIHPIGAVLTKQNNE